MSSPSRSAVAACLARHRPGRHPALPSRTNHLEAGVLVPLVWGEAGPDVLLTVRAAGLRRNPGQVCFPGGRPEASDPDLEATARREAREELGIEAGPLLGRLSSIPLYTSDFRLEPFVAEVEDGPLRPSPGEVARVLRTPLAALLARPRIDAVPFHLPDGRDLLSPVFALEGTLVVGATAHALLELLEVVAPAFGRATPPLVPGRYGVSDVLPELFPDGGEA